MSDMAGYAARVAVERSGSCRDTMELMGSATWPVKPRGSGRAERGRARYNGAAGREHIDGQTEKVDMGGST